MLASIFGEFARKRRTEGKVSAWRWLQTEMAENASVLCPSVVSLKDIIDAQAKIEDRLEDTPGETGKSPMEFLSEYLSKVDAERTQ